MEKQAGIAALNLRQALFSQVVAGLVGLVVAVWMFGVSAAAGVAYGVALSMLVAVLLGRRLAAAAECAPERGQRMLYAGAAGRFALVLMALAAAWAFGLHLLAVAAGMLTAQLAMFVYAARHARRSMKKQNT